MVGQYSYPFAAIVGQEQVKRGVLMAIVNPKAGGLLIGGAKGTAKSTIVRGVSEIINNKKRIDLPLNATEDMLFGTIDIEYAIQKGERKFSPGILARANENILYITRYLYFCRIKFSLSYSFENSNNLCSTIKRTKKPSQILDWAN